MQKHWGRSSTGKALALALFCSGTLFTAAFCAESPSAKAVNPDDERWQKSLDSGKEALNRQDYDKAEEVLQLAVAQAKNFGDNDTRLAVSLTDLADVERLQGLKNSQKSESSTKIAAIFMAAVFVLTFCLAFALVAPRFKGKAGPLITWGLFIAGWALLAMPLFKGLIASMSDEDRNLAQKKYESCENLYKQALKIWDASGKTDDPGSIETLTGYATFLRQTNRDADAKKLEEKAYAQAAGVKQTLP